MRALEEFFGFDLMERTAGGLALTDRSRLYARALTEAFGRIARASDDLVAGRTGTVLTLRAYTSFLIWWLVPRLPRFRVRHPDIEVRLISANENVHLYGGAADLRVRYGNGGWRDAHSVLIMRDELRPVCSPVLLDPAARPYSPDILREKILLHATLRPNDWSDWLAEASAPGLSGRDNLQFEELSVAYQAALAGAGVALGQRFYLAAALRDGSLFEPFEACLRRTTGYYLVCAPERAAEPAIAAFREWLLGVVDEEAAAQA